MSGRWFFVVALAAGCVARNPSYLPPGEGAFPFFDGGVIGVADLACADTNDDPRNCGACGHDCTALPDVVAVSCQSGRCVIGACAPGRAHCSGNVDDGCETDVTTSAHCGACALSCGAAAPFCATAQGASTCTSSCGALASCGTSCVDVTSDVHNCGGCGVACSAGAGAVAACIDSMCTSSCQSGHHACSGQCKADDSVDACGASCTPCTPPANATATCDGTRCGFTCVSGFVVSGHSCVPANPTGCGTGTHQCGSKCVANTSTSSCGSSCSPCAPPANATATCDGTSCGFSCNAGFITCGSACCPSIGTVAALGVGGFFACALGQGGGVECWGANDSGELGNATTSDSSVPVPVAGLSSGVAAIAVGYAHSCALDTSGVVWCWGSNADGEIGTNAVTSLDYPTSVSGLGSGVLAVAAGDYHSCALTSSGGVLCWGDNLHGELGNTSVTNKTSTPTAVTGLSSGVSAIAAGGFATCAILTGGSLKCWGDHSGSNNPATNTDDNTLPVTVPSLAPVTSAAVGYDHSCAVTTGGGVYCWGANGFGQLGNPSSVLGSTSPIVVPGLESGVTAVYGSGSSHTCALQTGGTLVCWGGNSNGQLGNNSTTDAFAPGPVTGLGSVTTAAAGSQDTCALTTAGSVQCWGANSAGQLGNDTTTESHVPVAVHGL